MSGALLDSVERHTRLAGHNRVAMLLFRLGDPQLFGINVFKVREVLRRPPLERMPGAHALIAGTCDYRGQTIPVIDLAAALGYAPLRDEPSAHLLVTEFSRTVQGFLVSDLLHMVHCPGESLATPEPSLGFGTRVNAITRVDGALCALDYTLDHGVMTITHTLVPEAVGGRGLAGTLVRAALDAARLEGWKVVPACSYAKAWMVRHPEFDDLRA